MHTRNATLQGQPLRLIVVWLSAICTVSAWFLLSTAFPHAALHASPRAQNQPLDESNLFLLPLGETSVELLTHTVDVAVSVDGDRSLRLEVAADYRFHNPNLSDSNTLLMQVNTPPAADPLALRLPQSVALESNGQILPLQATGNGLQQTSQLTLAPDERRTLTLRYTLLFSAVDLPAFVYPASVLTVWPGRIGSWRITLNFASIDSGVLSSDNWLAAEPDGWSYNGSRLQWLSEDPFPQQPLRWQVVHPAIWQEIQARLQTTQQQPTVSDFSALGDLYRQLFDTARNQAERETDTSTDGVDRERFYAQALAAYADGLTFVEQAGLPPAAAAELHYALAALYRSRSIGADGRIEGTYVDLMIAEAEATLASLPVEASAERTETVGWLADGLRVQARKAQQRKDWPAAIALLDRLAALPGNSVDLSQVDQERNLIVLEQALQFLEQGNREAAMALTGETFAALDLQPAPESQAIFARWEFALTIQPEHLTLTGTAAVIPDRAEEARQLVDQLTQSWAAVQFRTGVAAVQFDDKQITLNLDGISTSERLALTQATPQNTHWALLRTLLANGDGEIEISNHLIWQRTTLGHSLDLRPVADQWTGIGANLERDGLAADRSSNSEQRIRDQLRAITHGQEGARWHSLVRNSRVQIVLAASAQAEEEASRVWSLQLTDPPQPMAFSAERISALRLLLAIALSMAGIFALAGILWLLL